MTRNKLSSFMLLPILAAAVILLTVQFAGAQTGPVFRVGVLDAPDGSLTTGARLAVDEINSSGGVRGADGTRFRLELVVQNPEGDPGLSRATANFRQASTIALLGPQSGDAVLNNLRALQDLNIPVLTPTIDDRVVTTDTTGRLFRIRAAEAQLGRALATYLIIDSGLRNIATAQLDLESTAGVIGFINAASALGSRPQSFLFERGSSIDQLARSVAQSGAQAVAIYGAPDLAAELHNSLRTIGWPGQVAYNRAGEEAFRAALPRDARAGIVSANTWAFTLQDERSDAFLGAYVRTFGVLPDAIAAAGYDGIQLIAAAIGLPGQLGTNLSRLNNVPGVQGDLNPAQLNRGETSDNVIVTAFSEEGVGQPVARFAGTRRLPTEAFAIAPRVPSPTPFPTRTPIPTFTPFPSATPTPEGVILTVTSRFQNVRTGPGTEFDIIGQLPLGTEIQVIGANINFTWVVVAFRGQPAWMSAQVADVRGDLTRLPLIASPPTPTPSPTPTPVPLPDVRIQNAAVSPSPIIPNQPFLASVTVINTGGAPAGQFAIAATFPPNNVFSSAIISGLAPGQSALINLSGTLQNTGFYSVVIVADLNDQVQEGPGENNNNSFSLNYSVDRPIIRQGSQTLNAGDTIDLEGNFVQGDANWSGTALDALFGAKLGIIGGTNLSTAHFDLINTGTVNRDSILRSEFAPGSIIGIITADGNRGVIRVDGLPGNQLALTFRVYQTT